MLNYSKKVLLSWVLSTVVFIVFVGVFVLIYNIKNFPAISTTEMLILMISAIALLASVIIYHPCNKYILAVAKKWFLLDFLGCYIYFLTSYFAVFFDIKPLYFIGLVALLLLNIMCKFKVFIKIRSHKFTVDKCCDKPIFKEVFKQHMIRNVTQVITIMLMSLIFYLRSKTIIKLSFLWLSVLALIIVPIIWGVAECIDVKINKRSKIDDTKSIVKE